MNSYSNVDSFLTKLHQMAPKSGNRNFEKKKPLEKVFLNNKNTFGRYQVLPMNSVISDYPFVNLSGTREINIPRKNMGSDGTESVYSAWIRILPKSAYTMRDPSTGHEVSSLTASDENLLNQAYEVFDQLYTELDVKNNISNETIYKQIRKRNYTVFHAYCTNMWTQDDQRKPARQNFSGLFVVTSKAFLERVEDSINETSIMSGAGNWIETVYNRSLTGRTGFFTFAISKAANPGFNVTVSHQLNAESYLTGTSIPEEDAELMSSPVESFLGWQANRDEETPVEQRRLFNTRLITEAIEYMTDLLAKIRLAKQQGGTIADAIKATNERIIQSQVPTNTRGQQTNDPILAQQAAQAGSMVAEGNRNQSVNPNVVQQKNNDPFSTPPAAHMDPLTSQPVGNNGGNNFGQGWGNNSNNPNGLPF